MRPYIASLLVLALAVPATAQQPDKIEPGTVAPVLGASLKVLVLQGSRAVNNIKTGRVSPPVVEIRDENDRPVEGAEVIFRLPATGPGGYFPDQKATFRTRTNAQGQAACSRFTPSGEPGRFNIVVTATFETKVGQGVVEQFNSETKFNSEPAAERRGRKWLYIGLAAAGAGTAALIAILTRNSSSSDVYTISPGSVTVGPPR